MIPPKPAARDGRVSLWRYWQMFRKDILSAQPDRLYRAKMAELKTPFFRSFLINEPDLIKTVLNERPSDFPKSARITSGLAPLLGRSVFVTNGEDWARQRRIIDPAFEGGRIASTFPAMAEAAEAAAGRIKPGRLDVESWASHATADIIFRTLFSLPIEDDLAQETYRAFQIFQREQPVGTLAALVPWLPVRHRRPARDAARRLRDLIGALVDQRQSLIATGEAPDDLASKIMTTSDPETGETFAREEMVDQVAIFFLAGHETSAALLGWALWLLAAAPEWGGRVAAEGDVFWQAPAFAQLSKMPVTRSVIRETLRLYPPVPMFVREAKRPETFRKRAVPAKSQIVISPWHLHRNDRYWRDPDVFDPSRWNTDAGRQASRAAYLPFSSGARVCPGAGFAMAEAAILLTAAMTRFDVSPLEPPVPVAHLTVRSKDGIALEVTPRQVAR